MSAPTKNGNGASPALALELPDQLLDAIAERVLERLASAATPPSPWLTLEEAADYARMSKDTLYKRTGEISHTKQAGRIRFKRSDLDAWLELEPGGPAAGLSRPRSGVS